MKKLYTSYRCVGCNRTSILLTDEVEITLRQGRYISCSHCGCKKLKKIKETDNLKECMESRSYRRVNGAIQEVK